MVMALGLATGHANKCGTKQNDVHSIEQPQQQSEKHADDSERGVSLTYHERCQQKSTKLPQDRGQQTALNGVPPTDFLFGHGLVNGGEHQCI